MSFGLIQWSSENVDIATSTHKFVSCTSGGATHTKGAWEEVIAATSAEFDALLLSLVVTAVSGANSSTLLDISFGAVGEEDDAVVVDGLGVGYQVTGNTILIPLHIPAGTRVSVRCQSVTASKVVTAAYIFGNFVDGTKGSSNIYTLGANPVNSRGIPLTPGLNAKGVWTQIGGALPGDISAVILEIQGASDTSWVLADLLYDIGVGPTQAEVVAIVSDIWALAITSESMTWRMGQTYPASVAAGSQLWVRASHSASGTGADAILHGIGVATAEPDPFVPPPAGDPEDAGDLVDRPYRYEFRNLAFGAGTDFIVEEVQGLLSMPAVRDTDTDRQSADGATPGLVTFGKRTIAFDMIILGSAGLDIEGKLGLARTTFQPPQRRKSNVMEPFVFMRPGEPKKVIYVRCTKRDFTSSYETARGKAEGSVELVAPDPTIYSFEVHSQSTGIAAAATVNGAGEIFNNAGDNREGTLPLLTLTGPMTDPIVQNLDDDGRQFKLQGIFDADDQIRVDFKTRIVEKRSGTDPWVEDYSLVRNDSEWWTMVPGDNTIVFARSAGNTATQAILNVKWQDAWQ